VQRGSDVDNDSAIFAHKSFEGSLGHVESAESVNFKHSPEAISADFRSRRKEVASSAVDQDIEAPELLYHSVDGILARFRLADVAGDTNAYASCRFGQFFCNCVQLLSFASEKRNGGCSMTQIGSSSFADHTSI